MAKYQNPTNLGVAGEAVADTVRAKHQRHNARNLAGAWTRVDPDFDWDQFADELDRIRRESKSTPAASETQS